MELSLWDSHAETLMVELSWWNSYGGKVMVEQS